MPEIKKAATPISNTSVKNSFLSIKNTLDTALEKKEDLPVLDSSEKDKDIFSQAEVDVFWMKYLEAIKDTQPVLYNVLNTTICKLKDNFALFFEFPSNSAYEEFENLREDFFQKIRKQMNNYSISFTYVIKESKHSILLSPKQKFEKMLQSNPALEKLKNEFRLDIN